MRSAGLLPYRTTATLEVLVAHPGGPFWARKDEGAWSVIKGEVEDGEDPALAAGREFTEETGWPAPGPPWLELGETRLRSGKTVIGWAVAADFDPADLVPGTFTASIRGRLATFPEIDRVEWFGLTEARRRLNPAYGLFLDKLERLVASGG